MTTSTRQAHRSDWRWVLAAAALISAAAHVPVIGPHLQEAPYMGTLFVLLTLSCVALAVAAVVNDSVVVYALSIATCGLAVIGYCATRLVAFPQLGDDVGSWFEPLGVVSVLAESMAVLGAVNGLRDRAGD